MADTSGLTDPRPGEIPSASQAALQNKLLKRNLSGPGVIATSDGWTIVQPPPAGAGSSLVLAVMRSLDVGAQTCEMQEVGYDKDATKLTGESGYKWHTAAVGAVIEVVPPPNHTYSVFNMEGALRPVAEIVEPENLSSAILWWLDTAKDPPWAWVAMIPDENLTVVQP